MDVHVSMMGNGTRTRPCIGLHLCHRQDNDPWRAASWAYARYAYQKGIIIYLFFGPNHTPIQVQYSINTSPFGKI
jgi:hypothetical protein